MIKTIIIIIAVFIILALVMRLTPNSASNEFSSDLIEEDVKEFMRSGQKIKAIKAYRQLTGLGLKDAKDAVERMDLD